MKKDTKTIKTPVNATHWACVKITDDQRKKAAARRGYKAPGNGKNRDV